MYEIDIALCYHKFVGTLILLWNLDGLGSGSKLCEDVRQNFIYPPLA